MNGNKTVVTVLQALQKLRSTDRQFRQLRPEILLPDHYHGFATLLSGMALFLLGGEPILFLLGRRVNAVGVQHVLL